MKKKWVKRLLLLFLLLVALIQIGAKPAAVAKLYLTVEGQILFGPEEGKNELDDSGAKLYLRNRETLTTLRGLLGKGLTVEEVTGASLKTWPTPMYYVGNTKVGGNHCFFIRIGFRSFVIFLPEGKETRDFWAYVDSVVEAGLQART